MAANIKLERNGPGLKGLQMSIEDLRNSDVLVGIPEQENSRRGGGIGNAALLYIHTNGSPVRHIPARPVIEPAIQADGNRELIAAQLKLAGKAILDKDAAAAETHLRKAGQIGANVSKRWFTDPRNNWAPNAPSTIRAKGSDQPLIDTGALRQAITWVIRIVRQFR